MCIDRSTVLDRGVQMAGYIDHQTGQFVYVEEMEPELVVPDLTDFKVISISSKSDPFVFLVVISFFRFSHHFS
jgi:hypothetical protein